MTGDSLNMANAGDVADFLVQYVKDFKTNVGYDLYSVSPQNEPAFHESYASCQYSAAKYEAVVKALGPKLQALGGKTLIDVCQDMLIGWAGDLLKSVCDDTASLKWISAISVHGYTDGITPSSGRTSINTWKGLWNYANGLNKLKKKLQLWQTEISGYDTQWENGAMTTWQGTYVPECAGRTCIRHRYSHRAQIRPCFNMELLAMQRSDLLFGDRQWSSAGITDVLQIYQAGNGQCPIDAGCCRHYTL